MPDSTKHHGRKLWYLIETVGMGVAIGYSAICWAAEVGAIGNMHPGARADILTPLGIVSTGIGFILSILAYRRRRLLSRVTLISCILWAVWYLLPRL
jgi:hypothetical protein